MSEHLDDRLEEARSLVTDLAEDSAEEWDRSGWIPEEVLRKAGAQGLLCAQVPTDHGGIGADSVGNGRLTAHAGALCSSLRSVMTSQGMAAWAIERMGDAAQRKDLLPQLTAGRLAAVGFAEPEAGSDLAAIGTRARRRGNGIVLDGEKKWVTAACYADLLLVLTRFEEGAAFAVVPASAPGVRIERVSAPLGCRAAGHADLRFSGVTLPSESLLGGEGLLLPMVITTALTYGRMSVAWGCVGILRACLRSATSHAAHREQFGRPLADHQLVGRLLAELLVAERTATHACEHASRAWDENRVDLAAEAVLAKYISSVQAARSAASAVQVLGSRGADDSHVVARAYRDAKLMEIIEGSNEISQTILARHALNVAV
jgi:methoxymalonate biosynthesis protein